jgi:hypothetical protein
VARSETPSNRRCLIVERHAWETGGREQQLQFLLNEARDFFGRTERSIHVRVFLGGPSQDAAFEKAITISREYSNGTRRTNGFPEMGSVPSSFVFFQETQDADTYDVWWQEDKAIVAARYDNWSQGRNSQYGRGRLSVIVPAPVPRPIDRI